MVRPLQLESQQRQASVCDPAGSGSAQIQFQPSHRPSTKYLQISVSAHARPVDGDMSQVWLFSAFDEDHLRIDELIPPNSSLIRFNTCRPKSCFYFSDVPTYKSHVNKINEKLIIMCIRC